LGGRNLNFLAVVNQFVALSKSDREALKAIYRATRDGDGGAHTGALAERLGVTPGTVTSTIKRLADRGYVDHKPYRGVELTAEGRRGAISAIRRHRIVERFLADMLGYAWNEADRLATSFEHELPQEVEDRIFVALDRPQTCPHGFPIPAKETADLPAMPPLYALEPGDVAVVAVPGSTDPEIVAFLDTLGLRPGVRVEVKEKHPFDGPLVLRVEGNERTIGSTVAHQVFVQKPADHPDLADADVADVADHVSEREPA
jgi:DtxR family transcriptional regulator, Mn-dependent transcriptional regulator